MSAGLVSISSKVSEWQPLETGISIGKDILELLSSSMYVDPMTIYREYIQNAADSIDDMRTSVSTPDASGRVDIKIDTASRSVMITDNGAGISAGEFISRLTAFGGSTKRGRPARGFRGVGRLAGIGYCQELIFRSRSAGEKSIGELRWDCRKLKTILRAANTKDNLESAVMQVVTVRRLNGNGIEGPFFQVELKGIIRHRNDQLLSETAVTDYLAQVGPVPFDEDFSQRDQILSHIGNSIRLGDIDISVNGAPPIRRPFRTTFSISEHERDCFSEIELITVPAVDGEVAGLGWVAHHSYRGALPAPLGIRGIRLRVGNIQVGDERLLEELFPEARFNVWSVGEVHVLDSRIVPNGRRDHFDQNVHYNNLLTHLVPAARDIARRCRISSVHRKWQREFEIRAGKLREQLAILKQAAVGRAESKRIETQIETDLNRLRQIADGGVLPMDTSLALRDKAEEIGKEVRRKLKTGPKSSPLEALPAPKRRAFEQVIGLIYECSSNQAAAKLLVDKIINKIK